MFDTFCGGMIGGMLYVDGKPFAKVVRGREIKVPKDLSLIIADTIERVFWNEKKRTLGIKFVNGDVCTVHCSPNDTWDIEKGFLACLVKYFLGGNKGSYNRLFKLLDTDGDTEKHG